MNENWDHKVLVLDGETRSALTVVRALGAEGYQVGVASNSQNAIAAKSKFANFFFQCPSPIHAPETYLKWLELILEEWQPAVVLPVTDASLLLSQDIIEIISQYSILPFPQKQIVEAVSDKGNLAQIASSLNVAIPKTVFIPEPGRWTTESEIAIQEFSYPAVLKPRKSVLRIGSRIYKPEMFYVNSPDEIKTHLEDVYQEQGTYVAYMLQEKIVGQGVGVFALCMSGNSVAEFAHRRLLEKPPSGGRSVLSESLSASEAPMAEALALLRHFRWDGVAMVEFKKAANGVSYLMEINPRFWGSLQLAIDSKRNFPVMLLEMCKNRTGDFNQLRALFQKQYGEYSVGQRLRWPLGILDHALIRLKQNPLQACKDIFLKNSLMVWKDRKRTKLEVLSSSDLRPFICELKDYFSNLIKGE